MVVIKSISFIIEPLAFAHSISNKIFPTGIIEELMYLSYKAKFL